MKGILFIAVMLALANVAYASDACAFTVVSDETNTGAVATWTHPAWTSISGATWVWNAYNVVTPGVDETYTFTKTFTATGVHTATLEIAADNEYVVKINGVQVAAEGDNQNYAAVRTYDVSSAIQSGTNTIEVTVKNIGDPAQNAEGNPAGVIYKLSMDSCPVDVPEFGTIAAGLVLVAGIGLIVMRRK